MAISLGPMSSVPLLFVLLFSAMSHGQDILIEASRLTETAAPPSSVIGEKALQGQPSVADVLRQIAGLEVVRQGAMGQTSSVFIRGARSEDTLVLIDGVEANDLMAPSAGFDFANLFTHNIERVEIYKGPQAVRYGPGALGGVIHIITKEGRGSLHTNYLLEGGSFHTSRASALLSGGDRLSYSFGLDGFRTEGFSAADKIYGNTEFDGSETGTVSGKVVYRPTSQTAWITTFRHIRNRVELDRNGGAGGDDPNNSSVFRQALASAQVEHRFGELKSDFGLFYTEAERANSNPADSTSTDNSNDFFLSENFRGTTHHDYTINENHRLLLGLEWRWESGLSHSVFNSTVTEISRQTVFTGSEALTYFCSFGKWSGDLGIRSDQRSSGGANPSGRAAIGRQIGESSRATFSLGTGLKSPSLYQLYSSYGNSSLRSELADTTELEFNHKFSQETQGSVALFSNHFRDLISFDSITNKYFNISAAETSGAEVQLQARLAPEWSIQGRYTSLHTKDLGTGLKLIRRPQDSWGYSLQYIKAAFALDLNWRFVGPRDDVNPVSFARVTNPAYNVFDILGSYRLGERTRVQWRIENINNQPYQEVYGYGTAGLSFYAGLTGEI